MQHDHPINIKLDKPCKRTSYIFLSASKLAAKITGVLLLSLCCSTVIAGSVDLLVLLDKDGRGYYAQQTITVETGAAKVTLSPSIVDTEIIFHGVAQEHNSALADSNNTGSLNNLTLNSGSVIVRFKNQFGDVLKQIDDGSLEFTLDGIEQMTSFVEDNQISRSTTIVLPEELEFAFAKHKENDPSASNKRSFSIRMSNNQQFRLPIRFRQLDTDKDGVVDAYDLCPESKDTALVDRRGCELDADLDGVSDIVDMCPGSSLNATVDERGCEADADQDGLPDRYDQCDDTPVNYPIGEDGCALDSDADGVIDALDQCPDSDANEPVTQSGCSLDFDNDGIPNYRDRCANTERNRQVGDDGCERDSDFDGVVDRLDVCPNSVADISVDSGGCALDLDKDGVPDYRDLCENKVASSTLISANESEPFGCADRIDAVILAEIIFPQDSSMLSIESRQLLDRVARAIEHAQLGSFEIGAHTDSVGEADYNLSLSQARAETVRQYLMVRGVSPNRITARGYGETKPLVAEKNKYDESINRRVELTRISH